MARRKVAGRRSVLIAAGLCLTVSACGLPPSHDGDRTSGDVSMALRQRLPDGCHGDDRQAAGLAFSAGAKLWAQAPSRGLDSTDVVLDQLSAQLPKGVSARIEATEHSAGAVHHDVSFYAGSERICGHPVRVSVLGGHIFGAELGAWVRDFAVEKRPKPSSWPSASAALFQLALELDAEASSAEIIGHERCVLPTAAGHAPALQMHALVSGTPYFAIADQERVYYVEARAMHAHGTALVHPRNPLTGDRVEVLLSDLVGDGRLTSSRFISALGSGGRTIVADDHRFDVPSDDPRYAEIASFVHAEDMYAWMSIPEHRYSSECLPIEIEVHAVFDHGGSQSIDNAEYVPAEYTGTQRPRIRIGDGSGQGLQNLALDYDVVGHELGHHVLFRRLRSQAGESGVIHEGVSDYLLFARTEDPCLGESICPQQSASCFVPGMCLRTALNSLKLTDPELPVQTHHRSQFLSGMLWDIGAYPEVGHALLAKLVFAAVSYLQTASGYRDLVQALMLADMALYDGRHACLIYEGAVSRGLGGVLGEMDCQVFVQSGA